MAGDARAATCDSELATSERGMSVPLSGVHLRAGRACTRALTSHQDGADTPEAAKCTAGTRARRLSRRLLTRPLCCTQGTGLHYEGEFRSGKFAGQGILEYGTLPAGAAELTVLDYQVSAMLKGAGLQPEGSYYEGGFLDGMRHGPGIFECEQETYEGEFEGDRYHGKGTWTCHDDETLTGESSRYQGEWAAGKRHGVGIYTSELGASYEGQWREGLRHGQGVEVTVPPGASGRYVGQFRADVRHGEGIMHYDSGGTYEGEWRAGMRQGKGVELFVSGARYLMSICAPCSCVCGCVSASLRQWIPLSEPLRACAPGFLSVPM